ncbi:hypothetical protein [Nonomuraea jiangxiensis]|uniref:DUF4149 domain-containing protein n=1 Tax=Nonomuraea jiangxiensis TaxID=633440 RepID=A0A1G9CH97_9ACTN|nr:hypothetical protein [Nonomuraea jiangxiensis]SDK51027.1 hypothetical protein SAMN05421869_116171 [Nonomuraea jiangxiensis]
MSTSTSTATDTAKITAPRTGTRPPNDIPPVVSAAAMLWFVAVGLGVTETALVVTQELTAGTSTLAELLPQVGLRLAVFAGAVFLTLRLRHGKNWARWTLAGTLGVFGTLSLVVGPIQWLLDGGSIAAAVAGADAMGLAFAASRILHVLAVLGAMALMFQPRANACFRSA